MTRYKSQGFNNTFKNARKGFNLAVKSEINIRIHVTVAKLVLLSAFYLKFSAVELCLVLFAIALVICTEMLNTAIEFALDSIYHNKYSRLVGIQWAEKCFGVQFDSKCFAYPGYDVF